VIYSYKPLIIIFFDLFLGNKNSGLQYLNAQNLSNGQAEQCSCQHAYSFLSRLASLKRKIDFAQIRNPKPKTYYYMVSYKT